MQRNADPDLMANPKTPKRRRLKDVGNFLSREAIFAVPLRTEEVYVPEWAGSVLIREMTAREVAENGRYVLRNDGKADMGKAVQVPVQMCLRQVVDADGKRLFSDDDAKRLEQMHASAVTRIATAVRKLSGMAEESDNSDLAAWLGEHHPRILEAYQESKNPVTEAEENFTTTRNGASHSD
jgi:hypothetical protein